MGAAGPSGDTIVALSSGRPPAAVAIVRTSGPLAFAAAELLCGDLPKARNASLRTLRDPASGLELDSAIVLRFDSPHTATGEDIVEYQCHGGRAVVQAVIESLAGIEGLRLAQPGEFTRRSLANGRIDLTEAEGLADLLEAETESQRRVAMTMASGGVSRAIASWRDRLVDCSAQAEAAIDYVGEEDETHLDTTALASTMSLIAGEMAALLAQPRVELLKEGIRIVVAGPANAGKSSLVNALAKDERAIVTDIAGTTRDVIEVPLAIGGLAVTLVDTAGLREATDDRIERIGMERSRDQIARADILLWLGPPYDAPPHPRLLIVQSKNDIEKVQIGVDVRVSSVTGAGLDDLVDKLVGISQSMVPAHDSLALNRRQHDELTIAAVALGTDSADVVLIAESLRSAIRALDRMTGQMGVEDMLDRLFSRFCLGK